MKDRSQSFETPGRRHPKSIKDICVDGFFSFEKLFVAEIMLCPPDYLGGNWGVKM